MSEGTVVATLTRRMTMAWMVGHTTGLMSSGKGQQLANVVNIHTDEQFARRNGLTSPVPDGMVTGNWISSLLIDRYGEGYVARGSLDVKFIRSAHEGDQITIVLSERERRDLDDGVEVVLDVRAERSPEDPITVGSASAWVPRA